ncbi:hypothetical protein HC762_00240 [bacterium]|nr:hypothetical protein [bacterium]
MMGFWFLVLEKEETWLREGEMERKSAFLFPFSSIPFCLCFPFIVPEEDASLLLLLLRLIGDVVF